VLRRAVTHANASISYITVINIIIIIIIIISNKMIKFSLLN